MPKVGIPWRPVCFSRQPELVHGAEENTVEDVAGIGLDPNISALTEVRVLEDGEVLVEVPKTTDARILAGSITEGKHARVGPSCLVEITVRFGVFEGSRQSVPGFIGELCVVKEKRAKNAVRSRNGERPSR